MSKFNLLIVLFVTSVSASFSQELKANVLVTSEQIKTTEQNQNQTIDRAILINMQTFISDFINNYKWTNHTFQTHEKINCTFQINIQKYSGTQYSANVQIVATRPVFNTTYETQVFNFLDKEWVFDYSQSTTINYNENTYVNSLSSLISYYVYLILAYDYDSYSNLGGQQFLDKAQIILNNAQTTSDPGWKQTDGSNSRYWLIENLTNTQQAAIREVQYSYHRKAMDTFLDNPEKSRKIILKNLEDLKAMNRIKPNSLTMKWFFNMKDDELVSIFSKADSETKSKAHALLVELDATNTDKYATILKNP